VVRPGHLPPLDRREKEATCLLALAADRLVDGREGGLDMAGELDVVEPDDAEVGWDGQPEPAGRAVETMDITSIIARTAVGRRPSSHALVRQAAPPSMLAGPTTM
jgi:hypothetical protein